MAEPMALQHIIGAKRFVALIASIRFWIGMRLFVANEIAASSKDTIAEIASQVLRDVERYLRSAVQQFAGRMLAIMLLKLAVPDKFSFTNAALKWPDCFVHRPRMPSELQWGQE